MQEIQRSIPDAGYAPRQDYALLRRLLPKRLQPFLRGLRKRWSSKRRLLPEPFHTVFPYTQVAMIRQQNLLALARQIDADHVPGCVMECGVLDGGTAALMSWGTRGSTPPRPVHLFDSWQGLPDATPEDGSDGVKWGGDVVGSPARVRQIMSLLDIPSDRVSFHQGWFEHTFPVVDPGPVALLHVDADFYSSVKLCYERWYPVMSPGGFVQIDDYAAFSGCRKATDEFLAAHPELKIEEAGTEPKAYYFRKPLSVTRP